SCSTTSLPEASLPETSSCRSRRETSCVQGRAALRSWTACCPPETTTMCWETPNPAAATLLPKTLCS
ncbi:hypothetical protein LPJ57_010000, partial [Coemansia sp. RSA 486]